jgi:hypothetical protein
VRWANTFNPNPPPLFFFHLFSSSLPFPLQQAKSAIDGKEAPYEILKRAKAHELSSQKSAWSLRRQKSMRVQQWGAWIAYEDTDLQQVTKKGPQVNQKFELRVCFKI